MKRHAETLLGEPVERAVVTP
ncbi:MAG: hypothetical protein ACLQU9_14565 [Acidimicrobiales bacterium]